MYESTSINDSERRLTLGQERMRRALRYHFMNPKEKWQAKGTLPVKMILIIAKIVIITIQLVVFSENNSKGVIFVEGSKVSFKHLFLKSWEASYETLPYPPSTGKFAIYRIDSFYESLDFALKNYYNINESAIGPYSYGEFNRPQMEICYKHYSTEDIMPYNGSYSFSNIIIYNCTELEPIIENGTMVFNSKKYLYNKNFKINFNGMLSTKLWFILRSIQLKTFEMDQIPDCFQFNISINYDNSNHNGQVLITLDVIVNELHCNSSLPPSKASEIIIDTILTADIFALMFSFVSLLLCCRSIWRLFVFWRKTKQFFDDEMDEDISGKWKHFWSTSYLFILLGDVFIIIGTILKINLYSLMKQQRGMSNVTECNYFLGLGLFLGYCSILRYFSYFPKSSVLVNTIRVALNPLLRFSLCSIILYLAFSLFGWIILGPYHIKFRTLDSSMACLFSLMNGDDMYVTLSIISRDNPIIFVFSQIFIYLFCILFVFVVLNLILTIIIEAYDQVNNKHNRQSPPDVFWDFINSCPDSCKSPFYRSDKEHEATEIQERNKYLARKFVDTFCCCIGKGSHTREITDICEHDDHEEELSSSFSPDDAISKERKESSKAECNPIISKKIRRPKPSYGSMINENRVLVTTDDSNTQTKSHTQSI